MDVAEVELQESDNKDARIIQLEAELDMMRRENMKYKFQMEGLGEVLHQDQIKKLSLPKSSKFHWSAEMYDKSIQAYAAMHSKGYEFCRQNILTPRLLPAKRSIQRHLAKIPVEPGACTAFLKMLKLKVENLPPRKKIIILKIDEMTLKAMLEFDATNQCYCGTITLPLGKALIKKRRKENGYYDESLELATHALSAFIGGLCGELDQLVGFHFTGNSFCPSAVAKWMIQLVGHVKDVGLVCIGICMDMGTQNTAV